MKGKNKNLQSRRKFISNGVKAGLILPFVSNPLLSSCGREAGKKSRALNILILGGTGFLGPKTVAYALERGHKITTFTRGITVPTIHKDVFDKVESLHGDREDNLESLKGRTWDVVIDNSGNKTEWVQDSVELLKDSTDLYVFTSSTGVYFPYLGSDIKEDTVLLESVPEDIEDYETLAYDFGVMKTLCEKTTLKTFGNDRTIIVRPTYMFGSGDRSDRFTYWPERLSMGGEILVPGRPEDRVQYIDAMDVARFIIDLIEIRNTGIFNAVGPVEPTCMNSFVNEAKSAFDIESELIHIDDYEFLKKHEVWGSVPWIMPEGKDFGSALINNEKGLANGLKITNLVKSVKELYEWWHSDAVTEDRRDRLMTLGSSLKAKEEIMLEEWKKLKA